MNSEIDLKKEATFRLGSILKARCPACHQGKITNGIFKIRRRCPKCSHDFNPEPGYFLGAMAVGFILAAMLTIPPTIALKLLGADVQVLVVAPLIEFIFVGSFIFYYAKIVWLHVEYRMTSRLDGQ